LTAEPKAASRPENADQLPFGEHSYATLSDVAGCARSAAPPLAADFFGPTRRDGDRGAAPPCVNAACSAIPLASFLPLSAIV